MIYIQEKKAQVIENMTREMENFPLVSNTAIVARVTKDDKGLTLKISGDACHAKIEYSKGAQAIGTLCANNDNGQTTKSTLVQSFLEWLVSDKSVYYPIIKHLGPDFHVIREPKEGWIKGWFFSRHDVNASLLMNFLKSSRTTNEHYQKLKFWDKWYNDRRWPGGLTYLLMYNWDVSGSKLTSGHAPIENYINGKIDLRKFIDPNHNLWDKDFDKNKLTTCSYGKENINTWGGGDFNPHGIMKAGRKEVPTRFYKKYYDKPPQALEDKDIANFYKEALEGKFT